MDSFRITAATATGSYRFKINHSKTKDMAIGTWIASPDFRVGEHLWTVRYYPQGSRNDNGGSYASVFLQLQSREYGDVAATYEFGLGDRNRNLSIFNSTLLPYLLKFSHKFTSDAPVIGCRNFLLRNVLENHVDKDGFFELKVSITLNDEACRGTCRIASPTSFPHKRIKRFREENKQTDVTFNVDGKNFAAHRLILAAHSPVFEAELFGSMAESNMNCIKINEMMPSAFKAMLDFMYNGSLPVAEELVDGEEAMSSTAFFQNLLVAADRYAVEKLKSLCEIKLVKSISLNNVLSLLELAEKHTCSDLKTDCLKFTAAKDNLDSLVLTEGYIELMHNYPSLLAELKEMAKK